MSGTAEGGSYARSCTCGCGKRTDAAYWHAWQAGRIEGWSEGANRPLWWMRLRYMAGETWHRLTARKDREEAP